MLCLIIHFKYVVKYIKIEGLKSDNLIMAGFYS